MSMDEERRALERRKLAGEDVSRELEVMRRRHLDAISSHALRLSMAAKIAWKLNLSREQRAQIVRVLILLLGERLKANWRAGVKYDAVLRLGYGTISASADVGSVRARLVSTKPGDARELVYRDMELAALGAHYGPVWDKLDAKVRATRAGVTIGEEPPRARGNPVLDGIAQDMHRAIDAMRRFQDEPGRTIMDLAPPSERLRRGLRREFYEAYERGMRGIVDRAEALRVERDGRVVSYDPVQGVEVDPNALAGIGSNLVLNMERRILEALRVPAEFMREDEGNSNYANARAALPQGPPGTVARNVYRVLPNGTLELIRSVPGRGDGRSPAPPSPAPGS